MANYEPKTKPTAVTVEQFIAAVPDERRRAEAAVLDAMHHRVTGLEPRMWGPSLVGYGSYDYTYASGHSGTSMRGGFSPRKAAMTVYLGFGDQQAEADALLARLGKYKMTVSCLYINKLGDVDLAVLEDLIRLSWQSMNDKYPG